MEAGITLVRDEAGAPRGVVAVGRDVTWRRQMETSLRHGEAFLRTLIEHSADTILVLDVDGTVLARPNRGDSPIGPYGYGSEAVLGRLGRDFLHPDDAAAVAKAFLQVTAAAHATAAVECRLRDSTGSWRPSEIVLCNLLDDPAVCGVMCTVRDLTARKRAEAQLRAARDAAEAASQAKTEFLNTMSHELRTPIHAILGYAEMLEEGGFGELAAEQREAVQRIAERARDELELVTAVLDVNAMESGRVIARAEPVRVADVVAQIEREGRKPWSESGLEMVWDVPATLPPIASDAGKIKIVVRNLVGNAVKFTTRGTVTVRARRVRAGIEISVADTGIGIPPEARDAIFEPFFQVDGSESRRYEGSGLGLHIVKRLLGLLGGTIEVESTLGQGSTFRAWLPLFPPAASAPDAAQHTPEAPPPSGGAGIVAA
jgi:PAS domain S-box-containing protein